MVSVLTGLKIMQLLPNGIGGTVMSLDFLHGMAAGDFETKMGYPRWFPTVLGLFKLSQATMNWVADGAYTHCAQFMMAFQLGGVAFTHGVVEGKSFLAGQIPTCIFFSSTVSIQMLNGKLSSLPLVCALHVMIACAGFGTGYLVFAMGAGANVKGASLTSSPVKWRKSRGFS